MAPRERCRQTVALLGAAGATVDAGWLDWEKVRADPEMLRALRSRPT